MMDIKNVQASPVIFLEPLSMTDAFHRINSVIPDKEIVTVTPGLPVSDALRLMQEHGCHHLPVVVGRQVVGTVSFRSIATRLLASGSSWPDIETLPVDDFLEQLEYVHMWQELPRAFSDLTCDGAILVGQPDQLQGVVTPMDVLYHYYNTARAFVLLGEIEQTLRKIVRACVDDTELMQCIGLVLSRLYKPARLPRTLEQMTFWDLTEVIGNAETWPRFQHELGGNSEFHRIRTKTMLDNVRHIRNDVFHFKRQLTEDDYPTLEACRDWVLQRATILQARAEGS
jgi:CBS domain-containing protein